MYRLKKGISPVIATVIIVAVAVAIAIAVVGWIMGIWGTFGTTEALKVLPDSNIVGKVLYLHVRNEGTASAKITKIEAGVLGTNTTTFVITPGLDTTLTVTLNKTATVGATYSIKIYTSAGNVYPATVQCTG